jgi:hypothetical protein
VSISNSKYYGNPLNSFRIKYGDEEARLPHCEFILYILQKEYRDWYTQKDAWMDRLEYLSLYKRTNVSISVKGRFKTDISLSLPLSERRVTKLSLSLAI